MPFLTAARRLLATLPRGTADQAILEYLINNASGASNAKSGTAERGQSLLLTSSSHFEI